MDDFSGLEYEQESVSEEDVISKTNNLLSQFNLPTQVASVSDITAALFVVLYESLFSDRLPGIVRQPVTKEDEISNCQTVIDVLSADVIKDNLSHIRGVDIVKGKVQAINNLLDIFTFLYEYVIKQIESDAPTDTDDDVQSSERLDAADEDRPASRADSQDREVHEPWAGDRPNGKKNGYKSNGKIEVRPQRVDTDGGPRSGGGEGSGMAAAQQKSPAVSSPSPIPPNASTSLMGQQTLDSTSDLIREGERLERRFEREWSHVAAKTVWDKPASDEEPGQFDFIGVRPIPSSSFCTTISGDSRSGIPFTTAPSLRSHARQDAFLESAIPMTNNAAVNDPVPDFAELHRPRQDYLDLSPRDLSPRDLGPRDLGPRDLGPRNLAATEPLPCEYRRPRSPGRMRSTVAEVPSCSQVTPERRFLRRGDPDAKGLSSSYEDLNQMVQQIAALTRAAIDTSPLGRPQQDRAAQLDITDLSQERRRVPPSEGTALARELNHGGLSYDDPHPFSSGEPTQSDVYGRPRKGVATYPERKSSPTGEPDKTAAPSRKSTSVTTYIPPNTDYVRPSTSSGARGGRRSPSRSQSDRHQAPHGEGRSKSRLKEDGEKVVSSDKEAERAEARLREAVDRVEAVERISRSRYSAREVQERRALLSTRLHEMGKPTLASAQRCLETEDRMFQQKQGFVQKLYEEDFDEAADEVKGLLATDHKIMKEREEEYKKLMALMGVGPKKPKPVSKAKGFLLPKTKKSKTLRLSKSPKNKSRPAGSSKSRERPLTLTDDDDLMPVLLEEFPHLYLSEHTWHELRRKGIMQIENLTRAYEENKRWKSRAEIQLEEAARKHELMASIVKKQLDHSQRMQQMKEQKRQQVMLTNKVHEKRSQSARTHRYYNEYQVRARSKMLKQRTREEMIFKNLFKDGLAIQKERIQEVRRYAREQREKQAQRRQDEIDSMENFYRDQFEVLVDKLLKDKDVMTAREKAHQKMLEQMKRELRTKMEKEIQDIQFQMFRDDDDVYIKQLEADRLRHKLQHARYQTRI